MVAGALGVALVGCGGDADSDNGADPAASGIPGSGQQSPSVPADGPLTGLLLVEGDAGGLWGVEKDDAALGADVQLSPVDMYPVEPLFLACDPPSPEGEPLLEGAVRNHETTAADGLNGQAFQTVATGDPDDVDAAYAALAGLYVVIDADTHLAVLAGFGFTADGQSSPELTDEQVATIAQAAEARLP